MQMAGAMASRSERGLGPRNKAPVFVLGCPRSGTTLLYHMLLSSGNFAVYRAESNVLNLLEPRFGKLSVPGNKRRLLDAWYRTRLYTRSGLERHEIEPSIMAECGNGGDFLRMVMEAIARKQGVERWADTTPEHLLYLLRIKETIPDALIIHIIRDGRDVALSMDRQKYVRRLPGDHKPSVMASGLYWEWMVRKGREAGRRLGNSYTEIHFEELVSQPRETLAQLSEFIEEGLDYDRIQEAGIGSVREPNTSFATDEELSPVGRWKTGYSPGDLAAFESLVGTTLVELGYELGAENRDLLHRPDLRGMRAMYKMYFDTKLFLKSKTPLGRWLVTKDLSWV